MSSKERTTIASGIYSMMRQLGGVAGVAVLAAVFAAAGGYESFSTGFTRALAVCGVLSLLGALAGLGITVRRSPSPGALVVRQEPVEELV